MSLAETMRKYSFIPRTHCVLRSPAASGSQPSLRGAGRGAAVWCVLAPARWSRGDMTLGETMWKGSPAQGQHRGWWLVTWAIWKPHEPGKVT